MNRVTGCIVALAVVVGGGGPVTACAAVPSSAHKTKEPITVEPIGTTGVKRLTLEDKAVQRLGITTAQIVAAPAVPGGDPAAAPRLVMPYSALLYLPDGTTFAYTNPQGHTYVREQVTVEGIQSDQVVLTSGPAAGTAVVTTGGTELWGAEFGIK